MYLWLGFILAYNILRIVKAMPLWGGIVIYLLLEIVMGVLRYVFTEIVSYIFPCLVVLTLISGNFE